MHGNSPGLRVPGREVEREEVAALRFWVKGIVGIGLTDVMFGSVVGELDGEPG